MFISSDDGRIYVSNLLIQAAASPNLEVRILALQCLIDYVKQLYDVIVDFLPSIL
jgi:hypothetical protein